MNQPTEDTLRAALARTAEGLDDNPERYRQVAVRAARRRRQAMLGTFAGVIVLVVGAALAFAAVRPDQSLPPATDGTGTDCPAPSGGPDVEPDADAWPDLPTGAEWARACVGGRPGFEGGKDEQLARIIIHTDVDKIIKELNKLESMPSDGGCTDDLGILYDLVLSYPDGRRYVARIEAYGCGRVQIGDQVRVGGQALVPMIAKAAERQRLAEPPAQIPEPSCPEPASVTRPVGEESDRPQFDAIAAGIGPGGEEAGNPPPVPYEARAVAVCRYSSSDPAKAALTSHKIVTDGAEQARGLVNQQGPEEPAWSCEPPAGSFDVLVFSDQVGGRYEIRLGRGDCKLFYSAYHLSDEPHPQLRAWVDQTLGGPPK
ncbi:MAG: hypothetical protein ACRDT6_18545 [Micromonosporaceae bacterium]